MFKRSCIILMLLLLTWSFATESRIESMGKRDLFFRDDMSIYYNPANIGVFGSFVTGSLGFVRDTREMTLTNPRLVKTIKTDTLQPVPGLIVDTDTISSLVVDTTYTNKTATPSNQWFGVVYNYSIAEKYNVFGGAAFNREDEYLLLYESMRDQKTYRNGKVFPELKGKSDYILGGRVKSVNFGVGYYSASQRLIEEDNRYDVSVGLNRLNFGAEIGIGQNSLEVFGGTGMITYSNSIDTVKTNNAADTIYNLKSTTDNSIFAGARYFLQTKLGGGLVFVPAVRYSSLALFNYTDSRFSGGIGINYRLDGGLFWAGVEGETYTTEDSLSGGAGKETITGVGARFNFGIEKSLIFKWLLVRVGGMKFIGTQDISVTPAGISSSEWVENPVDDGTSNDFLGFGIGLNYQNRLRFDITLNESLPYFNPFGNGLQNSSNGGHMLLRISSTFSL